MKVLLVAKLNTGNTYFDSLYNELAKKNIEVIANENDFWDNNKNFDIIHVHFLENIFNWNIKDITNDDFKRLKFRLEVLKKTKTKIIITRHNIYPYNLHDKILIQKIYNLFYRYTNAMIHLGNYSISEFKKNNEQYNNTLEHTVIKHGNYLNLNNNISKATARSLLNISNDRFVFLNFGTFRNLKERNLILEAFKKLNKSKKTLLTSSWEIEGSKKTVYSKIRRRIINIDSKYALNNTFVSNDNIQTYLNAADVLVVPRLKTLNSGLVYLGLSFGKIIVAPAIGNITEVIEQTNNVLFDPSNSKSLVSAMEKAVSLKGTNLDYQNMVYARDHCSWGDIAQAHVDVYNKIEAILNDT